MAKVFGVSSISKKTMRVLESLKEREFLERVGRTAVRHVQQRTRKGYDSDGELLKPLAPSTIRRRKELSKINRTSSFYGHAISNLHFSGQLIRSIKFVVDNFKVFIEVSGSRKPYNLSEEFKENKSGTKVRKTNKKTKPPSNEKLAQYLADQGRTFMGVDESLRQKIREIAARHLAKAIRREKKKK